MPETEYRNGFLTDDYAATWWPIYLEPIQFSGERITVAIAAIGEDGQRTVIQTAQTAVIGTRTQELGHLAFLAVESLNRHLQQSDNLVQWQRPFDTLFVGEPRQSYDADLPSILRHAAQQTAFLSAGDDSLEEVPQNDDNGKWKHDIYRLIETRRNTLLRNFNRKFKSRETGNEFNVDYVGNAIALNFLELTPRYANQQSNAGSRKILQLNTLRKHDLLGNIRYAGLYIKTPANESLKDSEAARLARYIADFQQFGDDLNVSITAVDGSEPVAERILADAVL